MSRRSVAFLSCLLGSLATLPAIAQQRSRIQNRLAGGGIGRCDQAADDVDALSLTRDVLRCCPVTLDEGGALDQVAWRIAADG